MSGVEEVRGTDAANGADGGTKILMIASYKDSSSTLSKTRDALAVFCRKAVTGIHREEPQFIEVLAIQLAQDCIIAGSILFSITRCHLNAPIII